MSVYELKPRFQALLRPMTGALHRAGVTANQVTVAACVVSVALGAVLAAMPAPAGLFLLVPIWFFLRMAFNAVDGMLAREFGQASALGAYLNELTDVISDSALYLPFALLPGSSPWLVGVIIALSIISEMAGVLGIMVGASRRYDGPMGKSDRAFVFGLIGLLVGLGVPLGAAFDWIWAAVAALLVVTIANRVRRGLAEPRRQ
ncbi:MAG: CDP-alcohol phosphatidyltransferase [Betaproteobacteria bacterium RIFCSPLOWO2_12_FULL_62_13]|nr:MAG: CDP-alcohol phosphatidyltransferase [Betaproteobacteria bacterium RIFCSPLOWO2_12_FULL_62_13]